jgi:hypothetical protein
MRRCGLGGREDSEYGEVMVMDVVKKGEFYECNDARLCYLLVTYRLTHLQQTTYLDI